MRSTRSFLRLAYLFIFLFIGVTALSQEATGCKDKFTDGKYTYKNPRYTNTIKVKNGYHYEKFPNGVIKSKLEWISDCEVKLTVVSNTVETLPVKVGDFMILTFVSITGNEFLYRSSVGGNEDADILVKAK